MKDRDAGSTIKCHAALRTETRSHKLSTNIAAIERVWEAYTAAEVLSADVDATMATMTDHPVVLHVPTSI